MSDIAANWTRVCDRVAAAAIHAGRDPRGIRIVAVSKTKPVAAIAAVIAAGATDIGENYVQEAVPKITQLGARATWHMVGHLQRNKAARAVELFDLIHTLDSLALGEVLSRHGTRCGRPVRVLLEINIGAEASKHGLSPTAAASLLPALGAFPGLVIDGLMTVPPAGSGDAARPYFAALRELRERLRRDAPGNAPMAELSMGMSDDFAAAIAEGATLVRIGRAIFGART